MDEELHPGRTNNWARDCVRAAFMTLRGIADRHARRRVLVLGDSHVRVFEHPYFLAAMPRTQFEVVYIRGGSAIGILNTNSQSGARAAFDAALAEGPRDLLIVNLGEVDTAYTLWHIAAIRNIPIERLMQRSVAAYLAFLESVRHEHRLIVLAATLPTLNDLTGSSNRVLKQRAEVPATQRERTDLTLYFNRQVAEWCTAHGIPYLDTAPDALGPDNLVKPCWTVREHRDHHYARATYARWLIRRLRPHF